MLVHVSLQLVHLLFGWIICLASTRSQSKNNPLAGPPSFQEALQDRRRHNCNAKGVAPTKSAVASQLRLIWHVGGPVWMPVMMTCAEHPQLWPRQSLPTPPPGLFQSQCPTPPCLLATAPGRVTCRQSTPPLLSFKITGTAMLLTDQHIIAFACHSRLYIFILGEAMCAMHAQYCLCPMVMSLQSISANPVMLHVQSCST